MCIRDSLFVGAPLATVAGQQQGAVYCYKRNGSSFVFQSTIQSVLDVYKRQAVALSKASTTITIEYTPFLYLALTVPSQAWVGSLGIRSSA